MFPPRFLTLLASLSLLMSSVCAANLRKDAAAAVLSEDIPVDHERAAAAYKSFMKSSQQRNKNSENFAAEAIAAAHVNARKYVQDLHKAGKLTEMQRKATTLNADLHVRNGAFVTRRRPNGDCSGAVHSIYATRIDDSCQSDGFGGSYTMSCTHEDEQGNVQMHSAYFSEEGCMSGGWGDQLVVYRSKCAFDNSAQLYESDGPAMVAVQCTSNSINIAIQSGSIAQVFFAEGDDTCSGAPQKLHVQRYGACELIYQTDNNDNTIGFSFMTFDSCAPETGKAQLTIYTDSACLRPVYRGSYNIGGMDGAPYGACTPIGDANFGLTTCFPKGGMP